MSEQIGYKISNGYVDGGIITKKKLLWSGERTLTDMATFIISEEINAGDVIEICYSVGNLNSYTKEYKKFVITDNLQLNNLDISYCSVSGTTVNLYSFSISVIGNNITFGKTMKSSITSNSFNISSSSLTIFSINKVIE